MINRSLILAAIISLCLAPKLRADTNIQAILLYWYKYNISTNAIDVDDIATSSTEDGAERLSWSKNIPGPHPSLAALYALSDKSNAEEVTNRAARATSPKRQTSYQKGRDKVIVDLINESVTNSVWMPLTVRAFRARIRRKLETHPQRSLERKRR